MSPARTRRRATTGPPRPAIRLRPAPALEPPFDDELPASPDSIGGTEQLALDLHGVSRSAGTHPPGAHRTGTHPGGARPTGANDPGPELGRGPGTPGTVAGANGRSGPSDTVVGGTGLLRGSVESWQAARRFIGICLEILNGYRPAGHIRPLTSPAHLAVVVEQLGLAKERASALTRRETRSGRPGAHNRGPGTARGPIRRPDAVRLSLLRVCEPSRGVVEAAAVLHTGGSTWALAVRLERRRDRWLCTVARTV